MSHNNKRSSSIILEEDTTLVNKKLKSDIESLPIEENKEFLSCFSRHYYCIICQSDSGHRAHKDPQGCGDSLCPYNKSYICEGKCLEAHKQSVFHKNRTIDRQRKCYACGQYFEDMQASIKDSVMHIQYCSFECRHNWQKSRVCSRSTCNRLYRMENPCPESTHGCFPCKEFCNRSCAAMHEREKKRCCESCEKIYTLNDKVSTKDMWASPYQDGQEQYCSKVCDQDVHSDRTCARKDCGTYYTLKYRCEKELYTFKQIKECGPHYCSRYCWVAETDGVEVAESKKAICSNPTCDFPAFIPQELPSWKYKQVYCSDFCLQNHTSKRACVQCGKDYRLIESEPHSRYSHYSCSQVCQEKIHLLRDGSVF